MKRLVKICMLLLFAYLQAGYFIHSSALRKTARREFKETFLANMPDSVFQQFSLPSIAAQIRWEEEGREFWLNEQLFDVVKTKQVDGITYLYCINDTKEEGVVTNRFKLLQQQSQSSSKSQVHKFQFPDIIFTTTANEHVIYCSAFAFGVQSYTEIYRKQEPLSPPPQIGLS